ncbi:CPBP family intramembrane glutamic endopeptidase [Amycolatopsis nigrescens]|uniref:CPBP family intramembrane glutamic endopeptidase n=1 Tax=Amycolatopsis nigrescens TaxID=381445 RepID=UPI00035C4A15|nr:CPBP family intramembrane glutamic endopeptidase [Amycolatopsis nigrescens]
MSTTIAPARPATPQRPRRRGPALATALVLLATATTLTNRVLPGWAYPVCGVVTSAALIGLARWAGLRPAAIGLDRRQLKRGALAGMAGVAVVGVAFGIAAAVPSLNAVFRDERIGSPGAGQLLWLTLVRIPLGTVLIEEIAFRGVLPALLGADERWRWGPVLGAAGLFGLWHVLPSLALTQNSMVQTTFGGLPVAVLSVLAMLAAAGVGVTLHWLRHTGRSVLAPVLVHLATNSGGLLVAWLYLPS